jgi:hypothetical protein
MSPTFYRFENIRFFVNSREEKRKHVHIQTQEGEAKYWIDPVIELAKNYGVSKKDLKKRYLGKNMMSSQIFGTNTLNCEVTEIHKTGFWVFLKGEEYFIPFKKFPMFQHKEVEDLFDVQYFEPDHLYWKTLDIDIELDSIKNPEGYPLIFYRDSD